MAKRPVFEIISGNSLIGRENIEFVFNSGFADVQKKKNIEALHQAYLEKKPYTKILEISTKSNDELGIKLSAFNLLLELKSGKKASVECIFQASKVFEYGGPYKELLYVSSREAKKAPCIRNSGKLVGFCFGNTQYAINPKTFYYNWLYINTVNTHPELVEQLCDYSAFTDIEFNPDKSINCQAEAAAFFVSLRKNGLLEEALKSQEDFLRIVYPTYFKNRQENEEYSQISFDL